MNTINPFNIINLHGQGCFRSITLALPVKQVRRFLPAQLELGAQTITPPGTHPVILSFNALSHAELSMPSLLPSLSYPEFAFGVPYTYTRPGMIRQAHGPFYYMPKLFVDNVLAAMGGVLYWGYPKQMARFRAGPGHMAFDAEDGSPLISLAFEPVGEPQPIRAYPHFASVRQMLDQPLVSQMPVTVGPLSVKASFDKYWPTATLRPLRTTVTVHREFVQGFGQARYPGDGTSDSIDTTVLGSYELNALWRLGLVHVPVIGDR